MELTEEEINKLNVAIRKMNSTVVLAQEMLSEAANIINDIVTKAQEKPLKKKSDKKDD